MEVTRYIFQSPYSNQVQVGKPDVSSAQETKGEEPQIIQQSSGKELSDVANASRHTIAGYSRTCDRSQF